MNIKDEFEQWEVENVEADKAKEEEFKEDEKIIETIRDIEIKQLNGDRGFFATGKILRHKFTTGCVDGVWYKGWSVGSIKGLSFSKEYVRLTKIISDYLNKKYPKGEK